MKSLNINIHIDVYEYAELDERTRQLIDMARQATFRSYAPYSHFKVGAAIELDNGEVVVGANQENAAYPSGTCAERTACYYAHANYPEAKFKTLVIAARGTDDLEVAEPVPPCGACRQALLEYEKLAGHDVRVVLVGRESVYILKSVHDLMPLAFTDFD
jgi:cytidine deaminase